MGVQAEAPYRRCLSVVEGEDIVWTWRKSSGGCHSVPALSCDESGHSEMTAFALPENRLVDAFSNMRPYRNYLSTNELTVSSMISIPKQSVVVASSYLGAV